MKVQFSKTALLGALAAMTAPLAVAQPVIDGTADGLYGAALSVQNTATHFGDNTSADLHLTAAGGSEINQVFGTIANDRLYVTITGNLETNFNKLEVFLDVDGNAGGLNSIDGANLPAGLDGFCCGENGTGTPTGGALQRLNGLTFDTGFFADQYLTFSLGTETVNPGGPGLLPGDTTTPISFAAASASFGELNNGTSGRAEELGIVLGPAGYNGVFRNPDTGDGFGDFAFVPNDNPGTTSADLIQNGIDNNLLLPNLAGGQLIDKNYVATEGQVAPELEFVLDIEAGEETTNASSRRAFDNIVGLEFAYDNSNIAGVNGSGGPDFAQTGDPENVLTGVEFSIALSELGTAVNAGDIRLAAFINGSGHDFASNQFAGDGVLVGNLGGDGAGGFTGDLSGIDLSQIAGDQFVVIANSLGGTIEGDYDDGGQVEQTDLDFVLSNWGDTDISDVTGWINFPGGGAFDGLVDQNELDGVLLNWGSTSAPDFSGSAVPEPASLAVLAGLGVLGLRRRSA